MRSCSNNARKPLLKSIAATHCETWLAITVKFARSVFAALPLCRFTARSELRKVLFLALSVTFLFVYEMSREPLNGFAPNSHMEDVFGPRSDDCEGQGQFRRPMFGKTSLV